MFPDVPGSLLLVATYSEPQKKMPGAKVFCKIAFLKNKSCFPVQKMQIALWLSLLGYFIQHISSLVHNALC